MHRKPILYFPALLLFICLLCGCSTKKAALSEEQEAKVDIICQNVGIWGEKVYDSFLYWPINRIYISETESGMTVLTVGYKTELDKGALEGGTPVSFSYYTGVHAYAVVEESDSITAYYAEVGEWSLNGVFIDLEAMSEEELREAVEHSYLKFINQK